MESSLKVLKELRKQKNMNQKELAQLMNVAPNTISTWEKGSREPSNLDLIKLADIFNVSIDFLLGRNNVIQCPSLSKDEEKLLKDFKGLNEPNQKIILNTIAAFLTQQAAKVFGNVINNHNGSGNIFNGNNYVMS